MTDKEWTKETLSNRYQFQPWYVKLWRNRWLLMIPVWFLQRLGKKWTDGSVLAPRLSWSISCGTAHWKMRYWYTMAEVKERIEEKFGSYDD